MTEQELAELEALAKAASPGPWTIQEHEDDYDGSLQRYVGMEWHSRGWWKQDSSVLSAENAAFIAAANPQTMLALIARIRRLETTFETLDFTLSAATGIISNHNKREAKINE